MFRILSALGLAYLVGSVPAMADDRFSLIPETDNQPTTTSGGIDVSIKDESTASHRRSREQLLGDMGGFRTMLARHGMTLEIESLDEGFANPDGALNTTQDSRYAGLTDVIFSVDTEGAG